MGQTPSHLGGSFYKLKLPFKILHRPETTRTPNPEQPIKFQYRTKRRKQNSHQIDVANNVQTLNNVNKTQISNKIKNTNLNEAKCKVIKSQNSPERTRSEPNLRGDRSRDKHKHRRRNSPKIKNWNDDVQQFGYDIPDIDSFLTKVSVSSVNSCCGSC